MATCYWKINQIQETNNFTGNMTVLTLRERFGMVICVVCRWISYGAVALHISKAFDGVWNAGVLDKQVLGPSIWYVHSNLVIFRHPSPLYAFKQQNDVIETIDVRLCFDPLPQPYSAHTLWVVPL